MKASNLLGEYLGVFITLAFFLCFWWLIVMLKLSVAKKYKSTQGIFLHETGLSGRDLKE